MRSLKLKYPKAQFDPKGIDLSQESPKAAEKQVAERVAASGKSEKKASA
jgi:disulfide oxidoreductase YuzD